MDGGAGIEHRVLWRREAESWLWAIDKSRESLRSGLGDTVWWFEMCVGDFCTYIRLSVNLHAWNRSPIERGVQCIGKDRKGSEGRRDGGYESWKRLISVGVAYQ